MAAVCIFVSFLPPFLPGVIGLSWWLECSCVPGCCNTSGCKSQVFLRMREASDGIKGLFHAFTQPFRDSEAMQVPVNQLCWHMCNRDVTLTSLRRGI